MKFLSLVSSFIALAVVAGSSSGSPDGCVPRGEMSSGFQAKFYPYQLQDQFTMASLDYVSTGYTKNKLLHTIDSVEDINFSWKLWYNPYDGGIHKDYVYGYYTTITNFTMELTGYYHALEAGEYTFNLNKIDDSAAVFIGDGKAFDCCKDTPTVDPKDYSIFVYKVWQGEARSTSATVRLEADTYYPIRIVYTNAVSISELDFEVTTPDGSTSPVHSNTFIYQGKSDLCPVPVTTITTPWTGTFTSTSTLTPSNPDGTTTVEIFTPPQLTTVTTPWTGTFTSTSTITPSNSDGTTTVEIFTPPHLTTVTTPWTGTFTSTSTITPSNSDGTTTVEIFTPPHLTTVTTPWTGTFTSTSTITPSNSDGTTTVEIFTPPHITTVTTPGTGTATSTLTITPSNSDGTTTVEIFTPPHITTVTTPGTGTATSTLTITPSNSDGTTTVEIFTPPHLTTVTTPWTGISTSTSTITPSNSDGTTTVEVLTPLESSFHWANSSSVVKTSSSDYSSADISSFSSRTDESSTFVSTVVSSSPVVSSYVPVVSSSVPVVSSSAPVVSSSVPVTSSSSPVVSSSVPVTSSSVPVISSSVGISEIISTVSTVTIPSTTVITITSCSDHKCTDVPVTTGQTVVTITIDNTITSYTTYCPLSSDSADTDDINSSTTIVPAAVSSSDSEVSTVSQTTGGAPKSTPVGNNDIPGTTSSPVQTISSVTSHKPKSTVATFTSCDGSSCIENPLTAAETVVTISHGSTVITYTTYYVVGPTSVPDFAPVTDSETSPAAKSTAPVDASESSGVAGTSSLHSEIVTTSTPEQTGPAPTGESPSIILGPSSSSNAYPIPVPSTGGSNQLGMTISSLLISFLTFVTI
ncbi:flocculation protein Flo5p [[Candida] anglica]|uniref:Flocculation protein Flo5p n=1 Tax=[Candida] anglica TaxID=148631 RepID=A0ABP0EIC2_9ASCO